VYRLGGRFGVGHVVDVLRGAQKERILQLGHDRLSTYGVGADATVDHWRGLLQQLVHRGYLEQQMGQYPVLQLASAARPVLRGEQTIMLARPRVRVVREEPGRERRKRGKRGEPSAGMTLDRMGLLSGDDLAVAEALFVALRELRREIADREGVPPYVVFHDATLRQMATARPSTEGEMLDIGGVGERKLEKYGAEFLRLTRR